MSVFCKHCGDTQVPDHAEKDHPGECCNCTDIGYGWYPDEYDPVEQAEDYAAFATLSPGQLTYLARMKAKYPDGPWDWDHPEEEEK